jgi:Flp pilus assembly protein TadD
VTQHAPWLGTIALLAAASMTIAACGSGPATRSANDGAGQEPVVRPAGRVLIIGLDGADWEIIDRLTAAGRLPNLDRLRREGAWGVLRSEEPLLSPIVWTTIATGRSPSDHGIVGFLTERNGRTEPVRSDERKVRAFWNVASDLGVPVGVIGWYASWPAEAVRGFLVSDRAGNHQVAGASSSPASSGLASPEDIVPDVERIRAAVDLDVTAASAARFFSPGVSGGRGRISVEQERLDTFVGILRTTELYRRLFPILQARFQPVISAVYFEGTDAVGHLFAEYEPPPLPWTTEAQRAELGPAFGRYYEYVDTIVGELVAHLDPVQTTVLIVSDHGFRSGSRRPLAPSRTADGNQAPLWHRREGIVVLWGRGVRGGTRLPESRIYDVFPTVFRLLGLPLAGTLPGHPIGAALAPEILAQPARTVPDYDAAGKRRTTETGDAPSDETMSKLRALGYVGSGGPAPSAPAEAQADGQDRIPLNRYNRALVLLNSGRRDDALVTFVALERDVPGFALGFLGEALVHLRDGAPGDAVPPLEKATASSPGLAIAHAYLGEAYLAIGRDAEGRRELGRALAIDASQGRPALLLAEALLARKDLAAAARWFEVARRNGDDPADRARGCVGLAVLAEERKQFDEAERLYDEALQLSPALPAALERYGNLELFRDRPARAAELLAPLAALPQASSPVLTLYARALAGAGRRDEAKSILGRALAIDSGNAEARELLDELGRGVTRR